jgi:Flp pilus assembly protein TadG
LLSTTDRRRESGQAIVIFALAAVALIGAAALAFDTGVIMLEKRTQQNAADAAALAGARYLPGGLTTAENRARAVASANGYTEGAGDVSVDVTFPQSGRIRVTIDNRSDAVFAGIFGVTDWGVGSTAVAANEARPSGPFALLSLHPSACQGLLVSGSGQIRSNGNLHVNSNCPSNAFEVSGTGSLRLTAPGIGCNVVGGSYFGGGVSQNDCLPMDPEPATAIPDPYVDFAYPAIPSFPNPPQEVSATGMLLPPGCPGGSSPATHNTPNSCRFGGSYAGTEWRLFPGYYPGGIDLRSGTFYLEPGIYYVAGGCRESDCPRTGGGLRYSFRAAGSGVVLRSVSSGGTTVGGGVLIFNGRHTASPAWPDGQVVLQGGDSDLNLLPLSQGTPWDNMVIFQHRSITQPIEIVGGDSELSARGIIYAANAKVIARGSAGTLTIDQVIASTFDIRGGGGTINVAYDWNYLPLLRMAGLVE